MQQMTGTPTMTGTTNRSYAANCFLRDRFGLLGSLSSPVLVRKKGFMASSKWSVGKVPGLCLMSSWGDLRMTTIPIFFMMQAAVLKNLG